ATMRIFVSGGAGQDVAKIVEGYNEFANFIINGGEFSKEVPGVPIFFTANYAEDNSVFRTTFTTE
ncbi:hemolysin, partial [Alistipes onderdonkii]